MISYVMVIFFINDARELSYKKWIWEISQIYEGNFEKNCGVLPPRMGEHKVSWENFESMENMDKMENIKQMN